MKFELAKGLIPLYQSGKGPYPAEVIRGFERVLTVIRNAEDQRAIREFKGLRLEKLARGNDEFSLRLNRQYRLIVSFITIEEEQWIRVLRIEDYH